MSKGRYIFAFFVGILLVIVGIWLMTHGYLNLSGKNASGGFSMGIKYLLTPLGLFLIVVSVYNIFRKD